MTLNWCISSHRLVPRLMQGHAGHHPDQRDISINPAEKNQFTKWYLYASPQKPRGETSLRALYPEHLLYQHVPDRQEVEGPEDLLHFGFVQPHLSPCNWSLFISWKITTYISILIFTICTWQQDFHHFCLHFNSTNILTPKVAKKMNRFHVNTDRYENNIPLGHQIYLNFLSGLQQGDLFLWMAISCST